jgi:hypothetical protein
MGHAGRIFFASLSISLCYALQVGQSQNTVPSQIYTGPTNRPSQIFTGPTNRPPATATIPPPIHTTRPGPVPTIPIPPGNIVTNQPPPQAGIATNSVIFPGSTNSATGIPVAPNPGPTAEDNQLNQQIVQAFQTELVVVALPPNIRVSTIGGHVTLQGTVESSEIKRELAYTAASIAGPNNVTDQIIVQANP